MHYELFAIARVTNPLKMSEEAIKIASTIGRMILNNRGVIREVTSMGTRPLPKIITKDHARHFQGYHFLMNFDCLSRVQAQLLRTLRQDPRVIRASILKHDMSKQLNTGSSIQQAVSPP